jgi:hypothetical protein|tara:strand:+ start:790 stop:2610 length:1821 start_codon:yes stop_codon:yes gene_type:complete
MSVLNRKLFNRGGPVSSRGVGITSGLVPVQKFQEGGKVSKLEALSPFLLDLSGRLLGGTSLTGSFGEIAGQALSGSSPLLSEGLKTYREGQKVDDDRQIIKGADGYQYYVDTGERVLPNVVIPEKEKEPKYTTVKPGEALYKDGELVVERMNVEKDKKLYNLKPNSVLFDSNGNEIARGLDKSDTTVYKLNPGQKVFDINGQEIAYYEEKDDDIIKLNPGQKAFDRDGNVLFESPALSKEPQIFKLSQGQKAFDAQGNEIASVAAKEPKPIDTTITVSPGSKVFDKETGTVIFDNPTNAPQQKIYKAQPGTTLIDGNGNVIYEAPEQKEYFKLKAGESIYDQNGNVIASGKSIAENMDTYHTFKTADERGRFLIREYEKKAGFDSNGNIILDNLTQSERNDYERTLQTVDAKFLAQIENWQDYVSEQYSNMPTIYNMEEQLNQVQAAIDANGASGPIRGRITPIFGIFQDLTGIDMAKAVNDTFGNQDVLARPITTAELDRLRNTMSLQFQESMKGQVSNYEARQIVNSMFGPQRLPESNEIALNNMRYLNDLKKQMVLVAERVNNAQEFDRQMYEWKKENKPKQMETTEEKKDKINEKYGIDIYG